MKSRWDPVRKLWNPFRSTSVWNEEREARTNAFHLEARAYDPKVKIKDDLFPLPHEIYNCTTCLNGEREHPAHAVNQQKFRVKCTGWNMQWNEGARFEDIGCPNWLAREKRPRKGYTWGIDI